MKALALLFLFPLGVFAQESRVRLIGTNAVDFTAVYQELAKPAPAPWHLPYVASGTLQRAADGSWLVVQKTTEMWFDHTAPPSYGFPSTRLSPYEVAAKISTISPEKWTQLDPAVRPYFHPQDVIRKWEVRHAPNQAGEQVVLVGWPVTPLILDCGTPCTNAETILHVSPKGLVSEPRGSSRDRLVAQRTSLLAQQRAAEEGSGSAQYELGRRYLRGEGTETNLALAVRWLTAARTNGYQQAATRLLESAPRPSD